MTFGGYRGSKLTKTKMHMYLYIQPLSYVESRSIGLNNIKGILISNPPKQSEST